MKNYLLTTFNKKQYQPNYNYQSHLKYVLKFCLILVVLTSCKTQKQPVYGAFNLPNAHTKAPLAMFHSNFYAKYTSEIIDKISNGGNAAFNDFNQIYKLVYDEIFDGSGNLILPSYRVGSGVSAVSKWCKNAAFIYTINRKRDVTTSLTATQKSNLHTNKINELNNNATINFLSCFYRLFYYNFVL